MNYRPGAKDVKVFSAKAGAKINYEFLSAAMDQTGPWQGQGIRIGRKWAAAALREKIPAIDWERAADEVRPFIPLREQPSLALWSSEFFTHQLGAWEAKER